MSSTASEVTVIDLYVQDASNASPVINIDINIYSLELKWDGKRLKYDMITRWGEYEKWCEMEEIYSA